MYPLHALIARQHQDALIRRAERYRRARGSADRDPVVCRDSGRSAIAPPSSTGIHLRSGFPDDMDALEELACRLGDLVPAQPLLVAESDGELLAARSLSDGTFLAARDAVAGELVDLLELRAAQVRWPRIGPLQNSMRRLGSRLPR